jgi:hypothetical protein
LGHSLAKCAGAAAREPDAKQCRIKTAIEPRQQPQHGWTYHGGK